MMLALTPAFLALIASARPDRLSFDASMVMVKLPPRC
jgi:hypothetical protein